jgi:hypothetical protein
MIAMHPKVQPLSHTDSPSQEMATPPCPCLSGSSRA